MTARLRSLDGLRGVAALAVVLSHFAGAFAPALIPAGGAPVEHWLSNTPLRPFYDGALAVQIFFVLSGFVLAGQSSTWSVGRLPIGALARYLRLVIPMTAAVVISFALLSVFPVIEQLRAVNSTAWLRSFYDSAPPGELGMALLEPIVGFIAWRPIFDPVLWTMKYELLGSFGIYFAYAVARGGWRLPLLFGVVIVLGATSRWFYLDFAIGALIWEVNSRGGFKTSWYGDGLPLAALLVASPWGQPPTEAALSASAILFVLSAILAPRFSQGLSSRLASYLGHVSFPLYLLHFPILFTIGAAVWLTAPGLNVGLFGVGYLLLSISAAHVFATWIDHPALHFARSLNAKRFTCRAQRVIAAQPPRS